MLISSFGRKTRDASLFPGEIFIDTTNGLASALDKVIPVAEIADEIGVE